MNKIIIFILFIFCVGSLQAQGNNTQDAITRMETVVNQAVNEDFTAQDSYFLGRTVAAYILDNYKIYYEKPALTNYLNLILNALAKKSSVPVLYNGYYIVILDSTVPNAISTPGGHIFITRALVQLVDSEDMLAAVIAHELAHIQLKHHIAEIMQARFMLDMQQERNRISQNITNKGSLELFSSSVSTLIDNLLSKGYSQLQEFEADSAAVLLLTSAGYNPRSLIDLLKIMEKYQSNETGNLNKSHPVSRQRIQNLERQLSGGEPSRSALGGGSDQRIIDNSSLRKNRFNQIMGRRLN